MAASSATREPKLSDEKICQLLDYGIGQSVGFSDSKLSKERARVQELYNAERPFKAHEGDSSYVSDDVWNSIESMKAQLLDVFSSNGRPVKFTPVNAQDVAPAQIRTDYVTHCIFNLNPGYEIFRDTIEEGLKSRAGIVKTWWDTKVKWSYKDLSDVAAEELIGWLMQNPTAEVVEKELHEDGHTFKRVRVKVQEDVSQVRIKQLAGEEFGISPMAENIKTADLCFHRHEMTVSDLLKAGYDKDVVKDLQSNDRLWMSMESEKIARFMPTDDLIGTKVLEDGQNARRVIMVYECYTELDMEGSSESQLWKITKVSNVVLDKEPVDRKPFQVFVPLPVPNAFWGQNYAKKLEHLQVAKTYLTRSVVNHVLMTNNPKILVGQGALASPRELMENKFGGIVNVKDPSKIVPMPQTGLNPFVFQTIQLLDQQKQESTSISSLSQGLNHDAISKQNSSDMVHELITVSQLRQKIIARNFAEGFLRDLYTEVYCLVLENEKRDKVVQVTGQWIKVDPSQWPEEAKCTVKWTLGYGEADKEVQRLVTTSKVLASDPLLAQWYTPDQHYYLSTQALEAAGFKDIAQILRPHDQPAQPPANPMQQAEIAMKQADAAAKNAQAQATAAASQLAMAKLNSEHTIAMAKLQVEREKIAATNQQKQAELNAPQDNSAAMSKLDIDWFKVQHQADLDQHKFLHEVSLDAAELQLQQQAMEVDKLTANAQPRGTE